MTVPGFFPAQSRSNPQNRNQMKNLFTSLAAAAVIGGAALLPSHSDACTRVVYHGNDSLYIVGRSLDWKTPIPTNIYVYPRGMKKQGAKTKEGINWTSKYAAVYAVGYDGGVTEGMNEKGLVVNGLFCKGTIYNNSSTVNKKPISNALFIAWMLDNNATTAEVVDMLTKTDFRLDVADFDGGTTATLHWGITDAQGNSAILEFSNGNVKIYDPGDIYCMTNDPQWPDMKAIVEYWEKIGGRNMLPGTVTSPDRCVRGNYFAHHVEKTGDADLGASITRSIMANVSVPFTYMIEGEPNLSSTQWRSYANTRDLRYYWDQVTNNGIYYIDLSKCRVEKGSPVLKLNTSDNVNLVGDVTSKLFPTIGFTPMY